MSPDLLPDFGDPLLGHYLAEVAGLARRAYGTDRLRFEEDVDPEIPGMRWVVLGVDVPSARAGDVEALVELHTRLRRAIRESVPDPVASMVIVLERLP